MNESDDNQEVPRIVQGSGRIQAGAKLSISEYTLEGVDLPFGITGSGWRAFYRWLAFFYSRHSRLSLLFFVLYFLITAVIIPLAFPSILGIVVGAILSFIGSFINPVTVIVTRHTHHLS